MAIKSYPDTGDSTISNLSRSNELQSIEITELWLNESLNELSGVGFYDTFANTDDIDTTNSNAIIDVTTDNDVTFDTNYITYHVEANESVVASSTLEVKHKIGLEDILTSGHFLNETNEITNIATNTTGNKSELDYLRNLNKYYNTGLSSSGGHFQFGDNGNKLYHANKNTNVIYQFSCSTAYDVSTASDDSKNYSVNSQSTDLRNFHIGNSGSTMIVFDDNGMMYQYTLSTAWDISTASYDSVSFDSSWTPTDGNYYDMVMKSDGSRFYTLSYYSTTSSAYIREYTVGTPWTISSASYNSQSKSISNTTMESPSGIRYLAINDDGDRFMVGNYSGNGEILQMNLATGWDLSSTLSDSYKTCFSDYGPRIDSSGISGILFADSDKYFYILEKTNTAPYEYPIIQYGIEEIVYDLTLSPAITANDGDVIVTSTSNYPYAELHINEQTFNCDCGSVLTRVEASTINQITLTGDASDTNSISASTPYSLSTADAIFYNGSVNNITAVDETATINDIDSGVVEVKSYELPTGIYTNSLSEISSDGTKLYAFDQGTPDKLYEFTLLAPWDISQSSVSYSGRSFNADGYTKCVFSPDGNKFYLLSGTTLNQFDMSTTYDITTATSAAKSFNFSSQGTPQQFFMRADGAKIYAVMSNTTIYQYTLSTPYDMSTCSYDSISYNTGFPESIIADAGIWISSDGTTLIHAGNDDGVAQHTMSTPWNISTASYDSIYNKDTGTKYQGWNGMKFSSDGKKMFGQFDSETFKQFNTASYTNNITLTNNITASSGANILLKDFNAYVNGEIGTMIGYDSTTGKIDFENTDVGNSDLEVDVYGKESVVIDTFMFGIS